MKEAFVYCWTDKLTNKLYVGSHKGTDDDGYICSSKVMLEEYKKRPKDFSRQVIAHGSLEDIRVLEMRILRASNAALSEDFYNLCDGKYFNIDNSGENNGMYGKTHSEKARRAIGEYVSKNRIGINNPNYGIKHTEDHKKYLKVINTGSNNAFYGKSHSEETKNRLSTINKNREKVTCEYCDKEMHISHYIQWHGGKCKSRSHINIVN